MKKALSIIISMALIAVLSSCGRTNEPTQSSETTRTTATQASSTSDDDDSSTRSESSVIDETSDTSTSGESNIGIEVDRDLLFVEITLPPDMVGDTSEEELREDAEESGFDSYILNADGSVTYRMSRVKHQEFLDEFKEDIDEMIEDTIDDDDSSVTKISYNDDLTEFTITVDSAKYTVFDTMTAFAYYAMGSLYQSFSGADLDKIDVNVRFIDENGNELASETYKEWSESVKDSIDVDDSDMSEFDLDDIFDDD